MKTFLKLLSSFPIILLALYYIPFLGVILILLRYYFYRNKRVYSLPIYLLVVAVLILIPYFINKIINLLKLKVTIPYLKDIVLSSEYTRLIKYSKLLIVIGIIFLILSFLFKSFVLKAKEYLSEYLKNSEIRQNEIREKNDLIIKERKEQANNTHLVHCPNCGEDNLIVGKTGKCKYCRKNIS